MTSATMSLFPSQYDSLQTLQKREKDLLRCACIDGISLERGSSEYVTLLLSLREAIKKRQGRSMTFRPKKTWRDMGKTERNRGKDSYKAPEVRKREKSEASREIREAMQGRRGKH